jgi:hypothetical protein
MLVYDPAAGTSVPNSSDVKQDAKGLTCDGHWRPNASCKTNHHFQCGAALH